MRMSSVIITIEQLNPSVRSIPLPHRMRMRPVSRQGYPVPYFVARRDGEWDFRFILPGTVMRCMEKNLCWMCGKPLGTYKAFVAGPMCVVTSTSAEPPNHLECARYAALACPFLTQPARRRNIEGMEDVETRDSPGLMIMRNPGCVAVLVTKSWRAFRDGKGGVLIRMGEPENVEWYAHRRKATLEEVTESIYSGVPILKDASPKNEHDEIDERIRAVSRWLPHPTPASATMIGGAA